MMSDLDMKFLFLVPYTVSIILKEKKSKETINTIIKIGDVFMYILKYIRKFHLRIA